MEKCSFCGKEFDGKTELHVHWGEKHGGELNSHQEKKVKKARRKKEEQQDKAREQWKNYAIMGTAVVAVLAIVGLAATALTGQGSSNIDWEGQPVLGDENASVTMTVFADFRCPYCQRFETSIFPQIKQKYIDTGKLKASFINYAFLGPGSTKAAVASECVYRQNKTQFWDFKQAIYENQGPESKQWVTNDLLMQLARESTEQLNYDELRTCIQNAETLAEVKSDKKLGLKHGVSSTPTIFVNGKKTDGWDLQSVQKAIERELQ